MAHVTLARKGHTSIRRERDDTIVRYHWTDIFRFNRERVILDSNGWRTMTTKERMNQAASENGFRFTIYQKDFDWFVHFWDKRKKDIPFVDGMEVRRAKENAS